MKRVSFIEALQANETHEVESVLSNKQTLFKYKVGELKKSGHSLDTLCNNSWCIIEKPQIVEFECEWIEVNSNMMPCGFFHTLKQMNNGKKWRVRCEEIL